MVTNTFARGSREFHNDANYFIMASTSQNASDNNSADGASSTVPHAVVQTEVNKVSVKVPPFWPERPEIWFAQIEAQFCVSGITSDLTKFNTLVASMESHIIAQVTDAILSPPPSDLYMNLKRRIMEQFGENEHTKMQKLLTGLDLGDRRPSQLLNELRNLANGRMNDDLLKSLWMQRLPQNVRAILQTSNEDLQGVAKLADRVLEVTEREQLYMATTTPADSVEEIVDRLAKLEKRFHSRSRSKERSKSPSLCWYHTKFGRKATKCRPPCSFVPNAKN